MQPASKKILLSPLDWGLGHATRCLPLARQLQTLGATLYFAGTESQISFFRKSVPEATFLPLEGYNVRYAQTRRGFMPRLLRQLPGIFQTIRREHQWLLETAQKHHFDGILSDNRYGLWHPEIPSVFLTHQPGLKTGFGQAADAIFASFHQKLMRHFGVIWLADIPDFPGLSGDLAHPARLPQNSQYIGLLSQFRNEKVELHDVTPLLRRRAGGEAGDAADEAPLTFLKAIHSAQISGNSTPKSGLVILLSGPEPQRSILSQKLWEQVKEFPEISVVFIEGKADAPQRAPFTPNIQWIAQCNAATLAPLLASAEYVISRSGYSTLMDAAVLDLKLIVIPTPGQTEQEYLGKMLLGEHKALCFRQEDFSLREALEDAARFPFLPLGNPEDAWRFVPVLEDWYNRL